MLTIGVLGANGFVGSRLVEMFHLGAEFRVVPIAHSVSGLARVARFSVNWRIADATDPVALAAAFDGCDTIVHAIAGSLESIIMSPRATLQACRVAGVRRVVYLSTAAVHGQDVEPGTDEDSPLHTRHPVAYNNAKVLAERAFLAQHWRFGIELVVLRPGIVIGPRDVWITGIAHAIANREAVLAGGGAGYCNTIYVDNLVHAVRCGLHSDTDGGVFLVGDAETITWRALYRRVGEMLGHRGEFPSVPSPPIQAVGFDLIDALKTIPGVQNVLDRTSPAPKLWARRQLSAIAAIRRAMRTAYQPPTANPWRTRAAAVPMVSLETALLHRCRHAFSYAKARTQLGFLPPVSIEEALARCAGWLDFIGYRSEQDTKGPGTG
jgi:nucleoside-diphosphate-sugar epimerase